MYRKLPLILVALLILSSCKDEVAPVETASSTLFTLLTQEETGVDFINSVEESEENNYFVNQYVYNGGGVAIGDFNGDNLQDLYFTGNSVHDRLYINKGNLQFEDRTGDMGLPTQSDSWSTGVTVVDINADGHEDIYVCKAGFGMSPEQSQNKFYINSGDGRFLEAAGQLGLNDPGFSTQASFFDYDGDGDLDVYVMNYPGEWDARLVVMQKEGLEIPFRFRDHLFRNDGKAGFVEVGLEAGINNLAFGLGLITADFNEDGWTDIYVANDYLEADYLYINQKDGTFVESMKSFCNHNSQSSMGVDWADFNNDGLNDLFVAEMLPSDYKRSKVNMASMNPDAFYHFIEEGKHYQYMHNVLQLNTGNKFFADIAQMTHTDKTDWSWSPVFGDFDNDGDKDLFVSNGIKRDMMHKDAKNERHSMEEEGKQWTHEEAYNLIPSTKLQNALFMQEGDLHFVDRASETGLNAKSFSNGAISADLDGDGDLELVVNNMDEGAFIYRNNTNNDKNISLKLEKKGQANREAINASVYLFQDGVMQKNDLLRTRGFQSGASNILHFGLAKNQPVDSIIILWDDYTTQWAYNLQNGQMHTVAYAPESEAVPENVAPQFTDVTGQYGIQFKHKENPFNDFESEILLPHRQSMLGPFISVGDHNQDGLEDFYVGGALGSKGKIFTQNNRGEFKSQSTTGGEGYEDMGSCFFDADQDGDLDLYVVSGGNENEFKPNGFQDRLYINKSGRFVEDKTALPEIKASGSVVRATDFDNDGDLDLFVGGRGVPGKYPMPDRSYILINDGGVFTDQTRAWSPELEYPGMVTDALVTDLNGDDLPDLVITGEWMSIWFYLNTGNGFVHHPPGFDEFYLPGWYYSLKEVDYNGDGKMDIVAGNMGNNHKFHPTKDEPFHVFLDDFDENGTFDIVLVKHNSDLDQYYPVRGKQCLSEQMPFISEEKFDTYEAFSDANAQDIFGDMLNNAYIHYEAKNFSSLVLIQEETGKYQVDTLDKSAQLSAINGVVSGDFDGDLQEEILFAGNMFETEVETSRADAGVGGMIDNGEVKLNSGFFVPEDVKDVQKINTVNGTLILVGVNNGELKVFQPSSTIPLP